MNRPIFITARFRTGSTMLWNLFRQLPETCTYYEPLHDHLTSFIKFPIEVEKSHLFVKSYFDEYLNSPKAVSLHQGDFANYRLYLESIDSYPELYAYIHALVESVPSWKTAVLQFNRIDFRLAWIKQNFPDALLLHLTRNPRDQWYSTLAPFNLDIDKLIDFDVFDLATWARDLYKQFPFLATPQIEHAYQRFYYLWKLSYLAGQRLSDLSIAYEGILAEPKKSVTEIANFVNLYSNLNLETCLKYVESKPERSWKKDRSDAWFEDMEQKCESVLDELGLNKNFALLPLSEIQEQSPKYQALLQDTENDYWAQNSFRREITSGRTTSYEYNQWLNKSYKNALETRDVIQAQLNQTQVEREAVQAQLNQTQVERETIQTQLNHTQAERETIQAQLNQTQVERETIQAQLNHTQAERETIQALLNQTQGERDQIQTQLGEVRANREAIQAELHHVYNSRSYRITAPMRAVFGFGRVQRDRLHRFRNKLVPRTRMRKFLLKVFYCLRRIPLMAALADKIKRQFPDNWRKMSMKIKRITSEPQQTGNIALMASEDEKHFLDLFQSEINKRINL